VAQACGIADTSTLETMAEIEAFASSLRDVSAGPRFASVKIDAANLERVLSNRDGTFVLNRLRGSWASARSDGYRYLLHASAHFAAPKPVAVQQNTLTFRVCECLLTT